MEHLFTQPLHSEQNVTQSQYLKEKYFSFPSPKLFT